MPFGEALEQSLSYAESWSYHGLGRFNGRGERASNGRSRSRMGYFYLATNIICISSCDATLGAADLGVDCGESGNGGFIHNDAGTRVDPGKDKRLRRYAF